MKNQDFSLLRPDSLVAAEIEAKAESVGITKANMDSKKAFLLSIMAGLYIGMGGMFMLMVRSDPSFSFATSQLLGGLVFCLGLFLVVAAGAELFTGNLLMICGKLSKRITWLQMLKNLVIVYLGNLLGSLLMVAILFLADYSSFNNGLVGSTAMTVAAGKIAQPAEALFFKGIMCNFLVCLAVWISFSARTLVDKFVAVLFPITAFVACGFEHCIANMFFLPLGILLSATGFEYLGSADISVITAGGALYNLGLVTVGNIIGGLVMVGIVYWFIYGKKEQTNA